MQGRKNSWKLPETLKKLPETPIKSFEKKLLAHPKKEWGTPRIRITVWPFFNEDMGF